MCLLGVINSLLGVTEIQNPLSTEQVLDSFLRCVLLFVLPEVIYMSYAFQRHRLCSRWRFQPSDKTSISGGNVCMSIMEAAVNDFLSGLGVEYFY